jgi:hypothetical protein
MADWSDNIKRKIGGLRDLVLLKVRDNFLTDVTSNWHNSFFYSFFVRGYEELKPHYDLTQKNTFIEQDVNDDDSAEKEFSDENEVLIKNNSSQYAFYCL